ncbi:Transcription factor VIP1 -like protein [Tripterygium wilfordii]|uniref:Transcription factor VIP1 -like protein n=1 Tax=Tripterygium wilfordii TaxID=458696 RepID=A0A7J7C327_TRIWF|nr:basic leucine zipper 61-like [Tripterygium wilfordii]KAF5728267.1 Transcription factor VIP1 -like protein [Tripterygium wilfordii]
MARLPPKIPPITQNLPHQKTFNSTTAAAMSSHPSWVDEFLDFSSARRGAHRRSASDSIAFFEVDEEEETHHHNINNSNTSTINLEAAFDRLNDEQLLSMFSDDVPPATLSSPSPISSTPSDQNSNNENKPMSLDQQREQQQPKPEPGEVESSCNIESQQAPAVNTADPKRVKRILANRQSAQRSRVRKLQYISELERSVTALQSEVSALSPRVAFLDHQRLILNVDNSALKQRIAALAQDKIFKDAHQEALKKEIERLRQVYHHQQQNLNDKINNNGSPPPYSDNMGCTDKDHQILITSQLR